MNGFRMESTNVGQYLDDVQNEIIKQIKQCKEIFVGVLK